MNIALGWLMKLGRSALLMILVAVGTIALTRFAPGYFTDTREMDPKYVHNTQLQLEAEKLQQPSLSSIITQTLGGWLHGDLGRSRQYAVPVSDLIRPRLAVTLALLGQGLFFGWLLALCASLFASLARGATLLHLAFTVLLVIPVSAIATLSLLADKGGPTSVLILFLAARDFKFLTRSLRSTLKAPHFLHARAQGIRLHRVLCTHLLPALLPQLLALATLSIVTALSAIVPIEVIFDQPGIGQLAWNAAMNRDLPVLLAVTLIMAAAIAIMGVFSPTNDLHRIPSGMPA